MGRVGFCKGTPNLSSQCQPSGFSLGYEPRFGWVWGRGICLRPSRVPIILAALLRYNRVLSPAKVYSPRQISLASRLPKEKHPRAEPLCMRVCKR